MLYDVTSDIGCCVFFGVVGSCWEFWTSSVEGINYIKTGKLVGLFVRARVVNCSQKNFGCKGGIMDNAFQYIVDNGGIVTEDEYPYTEEADDYSATKVK